MLSLSVIFFSYPGCLSEKETGKQGIAVLLHKPVEACDIGSALYVGWTASKSPTLSPGS